jgi:hypothetical protein
MPELFHGLHNAGSDRIKMNVPNKFFNIGIFFNNDGFAAILKQLPMPAVTPVISTGIPRQKLSHERRQALLSASKKNMGMMGHQSPCINGRVKLFR